VVAQFLESLGVSQRASRIHVLLLSALLLVAVMVLEWFQKLDEAFEYVQNTSQHVGLLVVRHGYLVRTLSDGSI